MEIDNICRACMAITEDLLPMIKVTSEKTADLLKIGEMFEECFAIMVEDLPKFYKICMTCKIQLSYFYDFKLKVNMTHEKLLKLCTSDVLEEPTAVGIEFIKTEEIFPTVLCDDEPLSVEYLEDEASTFDDVKSSNLNIDDYIDEESQETEQYLDDDNTPQIESATEEEIFSEWTEDKKQKKVKRREPSKPAKWKYHCEPCGKYFRHEGTYNAHVNVHNGLSPYRCETCNKGFGFKVNYEYHMKNHNNKRSFKCAVCEKSFLCKWDLKIHMRVHEDLRPYICDICGKQFRVRSHMTDHLETHNEENTYECHICHQNYKTRATLKMHVSSIHIKDKQYFCPICDKVFNRKHHLKVHFKVHDNVRNESYE